MEGATNNGADLWRSFRREFGSLANEQRALVKAMQRGNSLLRAACIYNLNKIPVKDELVRPQEPVSWPLESGNWQLTKGPNEDIKAQFEALATRAGFALRPPANVGPLEFWLHNLCVHLRKTQSKELFGASYTGGYIEDVCRASAIFCSWLEKTALERSSGFGESGNPKTDDKMRIGHKINKLRIECGWSFDQLAQKTGIDKKRSLSHVHGKSRPHPRTLGVYAQAFSKQLQRPITANNLQD